VVEGGGLVGGAVLVAVDGLGRLDRGAHERGVMLPPDDVERIAREALD
jgi:hypothetical protein